MQYWGESTIELKYNEAFINKLILHYLITKSVRALWLVNQLWFIVPVNPWKNRASSELLYKSSY